MDEPGTQELLRNLEHTPAFVKRHKTTQEDAIRWRKDEVQLPALVAVADLNRDGAPDIVAGNSGQKNAVLFAKDKGTLLQETQFGQPENLTYGAGVADLNGDGYLDIAVAISGARNVVYFGRPDED